MATPPRLPSIPATQLTPRSWRRVRWPSRLLRYIRDVTRTFDAARLWALPRVGAPTVAGQGRLVVPVTTYDIDENQGTTRLWLVDGETASEPITPSELNVSKPIVSPDTRKLAFVAGKRGESDRQLYIADM